MNWTKRAKEPNRDTTWSELNHWSGIEAERKQFCIQQAVFMDGVTTENLTAIAEKIYAYVWGQRA